MSVRKFLHWFNLDGMIQAGLRQHHALGWDSRENRKEKASIRPFLLVD